MQRHSKPLRGLTRKCQTFESILLDISSQTKVSSDIAYILSSPFYLKFRVSNKSFESS